MEMTWKITFVLFVTGCFIAHMRNVSAQEPTVDLVPYMSRLQSRIKQAWQPPEGEEGRRVVVFFKVHERGHLSELRIAKTSGLASADQAALQAVEDSAPFEPLPEGAPDDVEIDFSFDSHSSNARLSSPSFDFSPTLADLERTPALADQSTYQGSDNPMQLVSLLVNLVVLMVVVAAVLGVFLAVYLLLRKLSKKGKGA